MSIASKRWQGQGPYLGLWSYLYADTMFLKTLFLGIYFLGRP